MFYRDSGHDVYFGGKSESRNYFIYGLYNEFFKRFSTLVHDESMHKMQIGRK